MLSQFPGKKLAARKADKVGLVSIGSIEEKLSFALTPLLLSSGLKLSFYQNYAYPQSLTGELIHKINHQLHQSKIGCVVFDLRIHDWKNLSLLDRTRTLTQPLQDFCEELCISYSIILSNGDLYFGNALGIAAEKIEAHQVLRGEGPRDLTKFILEIGVDIVLMTKKFHQRIDAKKNLRDKIISGEFSSLRLGFPEKSTLTSLKKGYVQSLILDELQALRSHLCSSHPGVGIFFKKKVGDWIAKGDAIMDLYGSSGEKKAVDQKSCQRIFAVGTEPPLHQPLVLERMGLKIQD